MAFTILIFYILGLFDKKTLKLNEIEFTTKHKCDQEELMCKKKNTVYFAVVIMVYENFINETPN
jgi:hypothetical protein